MQEVLNLYLEESPQSRTIADLPNPIIKFPKNIIEVPVDPQIALSFLVRYWRTTHGLT
jgi:hypothetical protein